MNLAALELEATCPADKTRNSSAADASMVVAPVPFAGPDSDTFAGPASTGAVLAGPASAGAVLAGLDAAEASVEKHVAVVASQPVRAVGSADVASDVRVGSIAARAELGLELGLGLGSVGMNGAAESGPA